MDLDERPADIRTARLYLRSWRGSDAAGLLPVLEANAAHLQRWIPAHVASVAPLHGIEARLDGFAADFAAARAWRFGIFAPADGDVYGEVDLFFRSDHERVQLAHADRVEIGYWLRSDLMGLGYATEAALAMVSLAERLPGMRHVEIRCDARNARSAALPRRLGFHLAGGPADASDPYAMVWIRALGGPAG